MKHVIPIEDFSINEMANRVWPVGSIIKCNITEKLGKKEPGGNANTFMPHRAKGAADGYFYMEVNTDGKKWLDGKMLFSNCLKNVNIHTHEWVRINHNDANSAGPEYDILNKNKDAINKIMNKTYILDGNEDYIMDNEGKQKEVKSSEYIVHGQNFALTNVHKEPVLFLMLKSANIIKINTATETNEARGYTEPLHERVFEDEGISIKLSDLTGTTKELNNTQSEVIAKWFSNQLESDIEYSKGDNKFVVTSYSVFSSKDKSSDFPFGFSAGPFNTKDQALKYLDILKDEKKTLFDISGLKVESDKRRFEALSIDQLIALGKKHGVSTTIKELLKLKRGEITGKKFGV